MSKKADQELLALRAMKAEIKPWEPLEGTIVTGLLLQAGVNYDGDVFTEECLRGMAEQANNMTFENGGLYIHGPVTPDGKVVVEPKEEGAGAMNDERAPGELVERPDPDTEDRAGSAVMDAFCYEALQGVVLWLGVTRTLEAMAELVGPAYGAILRETAQKCKERSRTVDPHPILPPNFDPIQKS